MTGLGLARISPDLEMREHMREWHRGSYEEDMATVIEWQEAA